MAKITLFAADKRYIADILYHGLFEAVIPDGLRDSVRSLASDLAPEPVRYEKQSYYCTQCLELAGMCTCSSPILVKCSVHIIPKEEKMMTPYEQGMFAAKVGLSLKANPYNPMSEEGMKWEDGWHSYTDGEDTI